MTANRGLFVPINTTGNVGTTELEARLALAQLFEHNAAGVPRSGLLLPAGTSTTVVTGSASNMSYNFAAVGVVVNRAANDGVYVFDGTGTTNVPTTAAPATNSRIDLLYVKQNDKSKGDADNLAVFGVVQGAAATTPAAPALPTGAIEVARATVTAGQTTSSQAAITQTFKYAALKGTSIPVRDTTDRATVTSPIVGQKVARLDLDASRGYEERWTGTAWVLDSGGQKPFGHAGITAGFVTATSPQPISAQVLRGGMTFSANGFTVPVAAFYRMTVRQYSSGGATGLVAVNALLNGGGIGCGAQWTKQQVDEYNGVSMVKQLAAGDRVTMQCVSPSSVYGSDGYNGTWLEVEYVGEV